MAEDRKPGEPRPESDRLAAALAWLVTGTASGAADLCEIPARTIRFWMKDPSWVDILDQAKRERQAELDAKFTKIIHKATDEIMDRLDNGDEVLTKNGEIRRKRIAGREAAWIVGVITDKRAVIRGLPTNITTKTTDQSKETLSRLKGALEDQGAPKVPLLDDEASVKH